MTRARGRLGYLPSAPHPQLDVSPSRLLGALGAAPPVSDGLRAFFDEPPEQVGQSCVGEALSATTAAVCRASGQPCAEVSPLHLYALARFGDGQQGQDLGSRPAPAIAAAEALGYVSIATWPREEQYLDAPPAPASLWDVERTAIDQAGLGWYLLDLDGEARCEAIRAALAAKHGVVVAFDVDQSFMDIDSGKPWTGARGPILGGHYTPQTHYDRDGLWHRGSWGRSYGLDGYVCVAWSVIASPTASEIRIVTASRPVEASS